ncbi:MAG: hypothetical protein LBK55_12230 [Azoarcus sp.]|jgi:hypothetical protein|nr:hypothetical protein [Azoarcus sp.]
MKNLKRSLFVGLIAAFCSVPVLAEDLGLAERRAIAAYEKGPYVAILNDIQAAATFKVPVEVQWNTMARPGEAASYGDEDYWTNVYFVPLKKALAAVTVDDMGKKALTQALKKIVVRYDKATAPSNAYENGVEIKGGVLTINFHPYTNPGESAIDSRAKAIQDALEKAL